MCQIIDAKRNKTIFDTIVEIERTFFSKKRNEAGYRTVNFHVICAQKW